MCTSQNEHHRPSVIGRVGHRLLAAGDDDLTVAGLDRLRGEHHGLESGPAHLVDGERRDGGGDPGLDGRLTRRRLPDAALDHVAHDHFFYVASADSCAFDGGANGDGAELGCGERGEPAKKAADRGPNGGDDDRRV